MSPAQTICSLRRIARHLEAAHIREALRANLRAFIAIQRAMR